MNNETDSPVCSILTARSPSGIAVILLQGPGSERILRATFRRIRKSDLPAVDRGAYGFIRDVDDDHAAASGGDPGEGAVDEVLLLRTAPLPAERFEICCHGGTAAAQGVVNLFTARGALEVPWARLVTPGTLAHDCARALLAAEGRDQAAILAGLGSGILERFFRDLIDALNAGQAEGSMRSDRAAAALETYGCGKYLRNMPVVVLTGNPNTGKSTLFNAILGETRALTSVFPGTTRDPVDVTFLLNGFPVRLVDTAGIVRDGGPPSPGDFDHDDDMGPGELERRFASAAMEEAIGSDLELQVADASDPSRKPPGDAQEDGRDRASIIHVFNKCDLLGDRKEEWERPDLTAFLPAEGGPERSVFLSALTGEGLADLLSAMDVALGFRFLRRTSEPVLFTLSQTDLVARALDSLRSGQDRESTRRAIAEYLRNMI